MKETAGNISKKLRFLLYMLLISLFSFNGCWFNTPGDVASSSPKNTATIRFSVPALEASDNSRAMIVPQNLTALDIENFILTANRTDATPLPDGAENDKTLINETFGSYSALTSFTKEIYLGEWTFNLEAQKKKADGDLQPVASQSGLIKNISDNLTVTFDLIEASTGEGSYNLTVKYPHNGAKKVKYLICDMSNFAAANASTAIELTPDNSFFSDEVTVCSSVNVSSSSINKGFYFLRLYFYSDDAATNIISQNTVYFQIAPGCTTTGTVELAEINTPYEIKYNPNVTIASDFSWADGVTPKTEFNKSMNVKLPVSADLSRRGYDFAGWAETPDATPSDVITGWNAGEKTSSVELWAIWNPKTYSIDYEDYKALSAKKDFTGNGNDTKGTLLPALHTYDTATVIPVPEHKDTANATFLGWYTDAACTTELTKSGTDYVLAGDAITAPTTLYAKWAFNNVYYGGAAASSTKSGYNSLNAIADLEEALLLVKSGNPDATIVMNAQYVVSTDKKIELSAAYSGVKFIRGASYNDALFSIDAGKTLTLSGVIVDGGATASITANEPAVIVKAGSTLKMIGSKIQNNENDSDAAAATVHGGGVYSEGLLELDNASSIINNSTKYQGGGVYFTGAGAGLKGGTIKENKSAAMGGGIYAASDIEMSGKIIITDNYYGLAGTQVMNNLYLAEDSEVLSKIKLTGEILTGSAIGITSQKTFTVAKPLVDFTVDYAANNNTVQPYTLFSSDEGHMVAVDASGEACLAASSGTFTSGTYDPIKFFLCDGTSDTANKVSMVSTTITEDKNLYLLAKLEDTSGATPVYTDISDDVTDWKVEVLIGQTDAVAAGTGIIIDQTTHSFVIPTGIRSDNYAIFVSGVYHNRRYGTTLPLSVANYAECSLAELDAVMAAWAANFATGDCYIKLTDSAPALARVDGTLTLNSIINKSEYEYLSLVVDLSACTGLSEIENEAFQDCKTLKSVTFPNSLISIKAYAFQNCEALKEVMFPETAIFESVLNYAFYNCRILPEIKLPSCTKKIGNYAFQKCSKLENVPLPAELTSIGDYAFNACKALRSVTIPTGVTLLNTYIFQGCTSLTTVNLSENITEIKNYVFTGCTSLGTIKLPKELVIMGSSVFSGCTSLKSVEMNSKLTTIGTQAFYGCTSLLSIDIPTGVTSIPDSCFSSCARLSSVTIPNSVTEIKAKAFYNAGITGVVIPDSVTVLGYDIFSGCSKLTSVTIGSGVSALPYECFANCSSLSTVTIPNTVTELGTYAFYSSGITTITIPESITSIPENCLESCTKLTSVTLPSTVMKIGKGAFYRCSKLESVTFEDDSYTQWQYTSSSSATTGTPCSWTDASSVVAGGNSIKSGSYYYYYIKVTP